MNRRIRKKQFTEELTKTLRLERFVDSLPKERIGHRLVAQSHDDREYVNYDKKTGQVFSAETITDA